MATIIIVSITVYRQLKRRNQNAENENVNKNVMDPEQILPNQQHEPIRANLLHHLCIVSSAALHHLSQSFNAAEQHIL